MVKKNRQSGQQKHVWPTLLQSRKLEFHCVAGFFWFVFYLIAGALERSTFSSGIDSKDSSFCVCGGTNYDTGLILRPKPAASSNTVSEKWRRFNSRFALHLRADSHHDRKIKIKDYKSCIEPFLIWPSSLACSFLHQCQSKASTYSHCQTYQDANIEAIITLKQIRQHYLLCNNLFTCQNFISCSSFMGGEKGLWISWTV